MSETEKPVITEEVRQYFKKNADERVERQKKIIDDLQKENKRLDSDLIFVTNQFKRIEARLKSWPFNTYIHWERIYFSALKVVAFLAGLKIIFS